ncbi:hypothetical protein VP01_3282g1 [Puccinia sorghi]|uniref:Uncharacterized protein n=1 Tax=Puccinia sorghi TaxID=27349 RepID=A0A0L6UXS5_9BASI|nr:hypothetical protein VP01_3282g1 [Puccinia sorghi]
MARDIGPVTTSVCFPPFVSLSPKFQYPFDLSLFIPAKKKQDKKTWVEVQRSSGDYGGLCVELRHPTIEWLATIPITPRFLKKDKFHMETNSAYIDWLETAANANKSEVNMALTMPNPSDAIKGAAKEDLLAAHAAHQLAYKTDDEELDAVDWERIITHMNKKNYKKNLSNVKYDCHLPVYIDPANPHRYLLITLEACVGLSFDGQNRGDPDIPPSLAFYLTQRGQTSKNQRVHTNYYKYRGRGWHQYLIASWNEYLIASWNQYLIASWNQYFIPSAQQSPPWHRLHPTKDTLNKLLANGFNSHKVFKSPGLLRSVVRELALTLGVMTVLFDNVNKYDQYLAARNN